NAGRAAYQAQAGYSGSRITIYANKRLGNLWMSAFVRYDNLENAVFSDSPLVETKDYIIGGFVLGWVFVDSPQTVVIKPGSWLTQNW
ncbi:MAG: MipA/OmpV family protein, partial [Gammaproteobacteria bacterium]|nr:MipA/OmpV family protein [Gammaproteobacteria bacterium]